MKLIAFTGKMGVGKTTAAQTLRENMFPVFTVKFAKPLYDLQSIIYEFLNLPEPEKDRKLLQFLGTDWGRSIDKKIWINRWKQEVRHIASEFPNAVIVCDDCRFPNEAAEIKALGGKIVEIRGDSRGEFVSSGENHSSETDMAEISPDIIIHNASTVQAFKECVLGALRGIK